MNPMIFESMTYNERLHVINPFQLRHNVTIVTHSTALLRHSGNSPVTLRAGQKASKAA
jgi:hypothetical protein